MTVIDFSIILSKALFVIIFCLSMVPVLVWLERKGSAIIQDRIGPNVASVGFLRLGGLIHLVADAIKLFFKEDITPKNAHKFYFLLAPFIVGVVSMLTFAVVPFADTLKIGDKAINMQVLNIDGGLLWFFAMTSLSVYGIVIAGWASNSKYSLLGGIRASAQMLSYEIPLGLSVIGLLMVFQSVNLNEIVTQQGELILGILPKWGVFIQPVGAIIFIVCAFAESNRNPFDLAEGESEIVGGFHTEYSSMKFGLFFLSEYVAMLTTSAVIVTLFFGGWQIPFLSTQFLIENASFMIQMSLVVFTFIAFGIAFNLYSYYLKSDKLRWNDSRDKESLIFSILIALVGFALVLSFLFFRNIDLPIWGASIFAFLAQMGAFLGKVFFMCWVFVWVRWTLPRFRYDQVMNLGWKSLIPLSLVNILITGIVVLLLK